jgi:hypothetical protein
MFRSTLLTTMALLLGLTLTGPVSAHEAHSHGYVRTYHAAKPYYLDHARPYGHGWYYPGQAHYHWEYRVWSPQYHRYQYWDPNLHCFYYYNTVQGGYYPCS